jgi:hypothetical protein
LVAVFLPVMRRTSFVADYSTRHFSGYRKATMIVNVASTTIDSDEVATFGSGQIPLRQFCGDSVSGVIVHPRVKGQKMRLSQPKVRLKVVPPSA